MIQHNLDAENSILYVRPKSALSQADFEQLAKEIDPFIAETGGLAGLIIETPDFPGWETVGAMVAHLRFVRDHHKHIGKVAIVTDSAIGNLAESLASHFVAAEIRHFTASQIESAQAWIMDRPRSQPPS